MRAAACIALAIIVGLTLLAGAVASAADAPDAGTSEPDPLAHCAEQGGCAVVTLAWLRSQLRDAFTAGHRSGRESIKCARPLT